MAKLVERIDALAGAIRDKFNQIMPRLLPPGGTTGQALVKASDASNSVVWANVEGGGGTSGPITADQLPINLGAAGTFRYPTQIRTDEYGRVAIAAAGSRPASYCGEWAAIAYYATASFGFGGMPEPLTTVGTPSYVELEDEPNGQFMALQLPKISIPGSTAQAGQIGFTVNTSPSFNEVTVTYKLLGTSNQAFFQVLGGKKRVVDTTVDGQWKTATLVLPMGAVQIGISYSDGSGSAANQVLISQITYPADTYSFGDVVTHDGRTWQCMQVSSEEVPGSGSDWVAIGDNLTLSNNLWNGSNVFGASVALNGTATAVTATAGTSSTQIATTEFVANATGALTPRLVPTGGAAGQTITRDGSGALTWANPSGGSSYTLATDTAPALGATLDLKGFDLKSILPANGVQNLKAIPQTSGGVATLGISARKSDDSAALASIQVGTLTATTGEVVLSGSRITISSNSNGTSTARYVLPSTTGTAGQVLTSSGSTTSAATWTTPTQLHPGYRSGAWYGTNCVTPLADNILAKNLLYATPVYVGSTASMSGLGVFTGYSSSGSFGTGSAYLGIYSMSGSSTAYPGTLVRSGSVSLSGSSTACTATVSSYSLAPGWYWMVLLMNTTTYINGPDYNDRSNASIIGMTGPSLNSSPNGLAVAYTYAALPSSFPTGATPTQACPTLYWKVA